MNFVNKLNVIIHKEMRMLLMFLLLLQSIIGCSQEKKNNMKKLMYVMDPQCGWCYGNSENIKSIHEIFKGKAEIEIVVGGMWLNNQAPVGGEDLSQFIQNHAPRMVETTRADVRDGYYKRVKDTSYVFSSLEPSAAIVWVKKNYPDQAVLFSSDVQKALFRDGFRLDDVKVYENILNQMNISTSLFKKEWMSKENINHTKSEFKRASELANGFPTFVFQDNNNQEVLASGYFDLEQMITYLKGVL